MLPLRRPAGRELFRARGRVTAGQRKLAGVGVALLAVAGLVWIMLLPMRQAPFMVETHEVREEPGGGLAIAGRVRNRGEPAARLVVEAYLYDGENRYLGTVWTVLETVPGDATLDFAIPLDPRLAGRVGRYSLYAGTSPNPFAPEPR